MASTKRTWIWVVLGILATFVLVVGVFIVGTIVEFRRHVKNEYVESAVAEQEFARTRTRFAGQQPLIEFTGRRRGTDDALIHRPDENAPRVKINVLRVLIYDLQQGHLIHADIPGWLLRMMPESGGYGGSFTTEFDDEFQHHRLTLDDLERHGLGLVLEGHNDNTRILMWTE